MGFDSDDACAEELVLYADNTSELYGRKKAIMANLRKKHDAGKYDKTRAVDLWMYFAEDAAKRYAREFDSASQWSKLFPPKARISAMAGAAGSPFITCVVPALCVHRSHSPPFWFA